MPVMIHKIHMGSSLPSVQAGKPYIIIGNQQSVNDYSHIAIPSDARRCFTCHVQEGPNAAIAEGSRVCGQPCSLRRLPRQRQFRDWRKPCGPAAVERQPVHYLPYPEGELDFDASIIGAHRIPTESTVPAGHGLRNSQQSMMAWPARSRPSPSRLKTNRATRFCRPQMTRLALVLAGPDADYASYVSEDAVRATGANGTYYWTFANRIARTAKGTYSVGIEGYRNQTLASGHREGAGSSRRRSQRCVPLCSRRQQDGTAPPDRIDRQMQSMSRGLSLHGGNRNQVEQCVLCHTPNMTDASSATVPNPHSPSTCAR